MIPAAPVSVVVEIILSGTGLKDSVTGYGPGKFVFEGAHFLTFQIIGICFKKKIVTLKKVSDSGGSPNPIRNEFPLSFGVTVDSH